MGAEEEETEDVIPQPGELAGTALLQTWISDQVVPQPVST